MHAQLLSLVQLFVTPSIVAHQAPLSMEFSRQEYQSGLPTPEDCPNPEMEPATLASPVLEGRLFSTEPTGKPSEVLSKLQKALISLNEEQIS